MEIALMERDITRLRGIEGGGITFSEWRSLKPKHDGIVKQKSVEFIVFHKRLSLLLIRQTREIYPFSTCFARRGLQERTIPSGTRIY
jgi:hypothetical protein